MSVASFATWRREASSDAIVLVGAEGECVRIRPRAYEVRPPIDLVEESALEHDARIREHGAPIELATPDGELARIAWASLAGGRTCAAAVVANVMTIVAIAKDAHLLVEQLVRTLGVGLGQRRRRTFRYAPPTGWSHVDHASSTQWRHPTTWSTATVFFARPFTSSPAEQFDRELFVQLPRGFRTQRVWPNEDVSSSGGLIGRLRIESGHRRGLARGHADGSFVWRRQLPVPRALRR